MQPQPASTLFPYTTLFRSLRVRHADLAPAVPAVGERGLPELDRAVVGVGVGRLVERARALRSEEHTSELQSRRELVCRLLLEKKTECVACGRRRARRRAWL